MAEVEAVQTKNGSKLSPLLVILGVPAGCLYLASSLKGQATPSAFLGTADVADGSEAASWGPLSWLHNDVMIASHSSYPSVLMFGFTAFGNVLLRKECGGKPYANWLFGYLLGFVCYTYPGAVFSDLTFVAGAPIRCMSNNNIIFFYTMWFLLIQYVEAIYQMFLNKHVFVILTTWWLADATRASLCFLERAVANQAVFARGVFQCFIWCGAGPIARLIEKGVRGEPMPNLAALQPNSMNAFKYPLVAMWLTMMTWLVFLGFFTDCNIFGNDDGPQLTMVECGAKHDEMYAYLTYLSMGLNIARNYQGLLGIGSKGLYMDSCWGGVCWAFVKKNGDSPKK